MRIISSRRRPGWSLPTAALATGVSVALVVPLTASATTAQTISADRAGTVTHATGKSTLSGNLTWWGKAPPAAQAEADYIKPFEKLHPKVHITFRLLQIPQINEVYTPALASNVGPDLFELSPGGGTESVDTYGQYAENLAPAVKKALGTNWKTKVAPDGVTGMTVKGKLDGISVGSTFAGTLWANKDLFDKYKLSYPTNLKSWEHDCSVFKANNVGCFVQGAGEVAFNQDTLQSISDSIKPGVWTAASKGSTQWTNPTIVKSLSLWKDLFTDHIMETGALGVQQYPDANNDFLSQKYALVMMGTWYMNNTVPVTLKAAMSAAGVTNPKPFTAVPIPFPNLAGTKFPASIYGDSDYGIAVNAKSKHLAAAEAFAVWMGTSHEAQQTLANTLDEIPALKGVIPQWSKVPLVDPSVQRPALQKLIQEASASTEPRLSLVSANLQQAIGVASQAVVNGTSPASAAKALEESARSKGTQ